MNSTRLALLALVAGLLAGLGAGFVLGGKPGRPVAAHDTTVDRNAAAPGNPAYRASPSNDLAHVTSQAAPSSANLPDSSAYDAAARSATLSAVGRVEATPSSEATGPWVETISGMIVDGDGAPLEGATIVAANTEGRYASSGAGRSTDSVGRAYSGPTDVNAQLEKQASSLLAARHLRRTVASDATGRFQLTGLRPGSQSLTAHYEGLVFSRLSVHTGEFARFVGRPVALMHLALRLPDGTSPPEATILIGSDRRSTAYRWTEAEPVLRLRERSATISALSGDVEATGRRTYTSEFSSEGRTIDLDRDGEGPHVFELKPRAMLRVTVEDASGLEPRLTAWVKVLKAERAEGVELDDAFDGATSLRRGDGQEYVIADLDAGDYILAAGRGDGPPEVTERIAIEETLCEQHLVLGAVDMNRFLVVRCSGPGNKPLVEVSFQRQLSDENGTTSGRVESLARGTGEFWLPLADLLGDREWLKDTKLEVTADARGYGKLTSDVGRAQKTLALTFQSSCDLNVRVEGDMSIGFTVSAAVVKDGEDVSNSVRRWSRNSKRVDADGSARLTGLQPGLVRVILRKAEGSNRGWSEPVDWQEMAVRPGDNEITFVAPTFHEVVIHAPEMNKGANFTLQRIGSADGGYYGRGGARLDATLRATFKGVAAGEYSLQTWDGGGQTQMTITVPTGEVLFQPDVINAFTAEQVTAGKLGAKAGLQNGDTVIAINGKEFDGNDFYQRLWLGLKDGTVSLSIYRGSRTMNLTLGPAEKPNAAWEEMGVKWQSASR